MGNQLRFSIIIPVYNAEKTLHRCMESFLLQTTNENEIILVNDGSKDGSGRICAAYAQNYSVVRYICKENGGVSSARNAGLDAAQGTYVLFADSDDYVPADLLKTIDNMLADVEWDWIILSNYVDDGQTLQESRNHPFRSATRSEALPVIIDGICNKLLNPPWGKVYRRDILIQHEIRFPVGVSIAEDRAFNIRYSMHVAKYLVSDQIGYYVNTENEQSLSRKRHQDISEQFKLSGDYIQEAIRTAGIPETEKELYRRAYSFGVCRVIYKDAKDLRRDKIGWVQRQKILWKRCGEINCKKMRYPQTKYCTVITLPVKLRQTWLIDLVAKRLLR